MKRDNRADQVFTATDPLYYEPIGRYEYSRGDFHSPVSEMMGPGWKIIRQGAWLHCYPDPCELPLQGWKIHLSSRCNDAVEVLRRTAGVLSPRKVPFKFLLDKSVLCMTTSKSWSRGSAGKFITVYPSGEKQFVELLEALGAATRDFKGPYILSDRRYKDFGSVYYRYGGIIPNSVLDQDGQKTPVIVSPSGEKVPDVRSPYFNLPSWVKDISAAEESGGEGLNNGRYKVEKSLGFSNSGGVYLAEDRGTREKVVIKEARPWVNESRRGRDVTGLLRKEYRILKTLEGQDIAPAAVELFQEWEHVFLVQEYLEKYIPLTKWAARNSIVLRTRFSRGEARKFFLEYAEIFEKLAGKIKVLHGHGVIFGDFSANNVMVTPDSLEVRLIDFEGAGETAGDRTPLFFTPGFSDPKRGGNKELSFEDDYYAFGANMLNTLFRVNMTAGIAPEISARWLDALVSDFGFPADLRDGIRGLMSSDPAARKTPAEAVKTLKAAAAAMPYGDAPATINVVNRPQGHYEPLVGRIAAHIAAAADYSRRDRLWPSVPALYKTNPLSVAYGASGVLKALKTAAPDKISPRMLEWAAGADINERDYPPGFHTGMSGIAWTWLDLGFEERARGLFDRALKHPLLYDSHDMFNGMAGWGMTALRFFQATGERKYLDRAIEAGERLLSSASDTADGLCWSGGSTDIPLGLAFGSSGAALFLGYLGRAAERGDFIASAIRALEFDLKRVIVTPDGGFCWPASTAPGSPMLPYLESGGAGVGMVCLRLWKLTGERKYLDIVGKIFIDCDRIYTMNPGRDNGLAGLGEFLLDAYNFTGEAEYKQAAYKTAAGIEKFATAVGGGTAFPGDGLIRFSCDHASGSAGIAAFLCRLESGRSSGYMLDELL